MGGILTGGRVFVGGHFQELDVVWDNEGIIQELVPHGVFKPAAAEDHHDARGKLVIPGLIDTQVRFGMAGIAGGSREMTLGGVTCVLESDDADDETSSTQAFTARMQAARRASSIDFGLFPTLGVHVPLEAAMIAPMAPGFSISWTAGDKDCGLLRELFEASAAAGRPVVARCEHPAVLRRDRTLHSGSGGAAHHLARSTAAETVAIAEAIELAVETRCELHLGVVSTARAVELIDDAKRHHHPITASTAPQYLLFTNEDVVRRGGGMLVRAPSIKGPRDRRRLLEGVEQGIIDILTSDHHGGGDPAQERATGPMLFKLVELMARREGIALGKILDAVTLAPAKVFRLLQKGEIEVGFDADFAILCAEQEGISGLSTTAVPALSGFDVHPGAEIVFLRGRPIRGDSAESVGPGGHPVVFEPPRYWN